MIFISSQPDEYFFLWQLEIQIYNFISVGIAPQDIHILIGYDPQKGLDEEFQLFIDINKHVNICSYPDTRISKLYPPSLRWHIIAKHLRAFPELQKAAIFHHDSDIVFKRLPDFDLLMHNDIWYASDTRSYLSSSYIKSKVDTEIFGKMCEIVGVSPDEVEKDDCNAGGAQYLIKGMSLEFLEKMERDSEHCLNFCTILTVKNVDFVKTDQVRRLSRLGQLICG